MLDRMMQKMKINKTKTKSLDPDSEWNKIREERAKPWFEANGDKTLRLNYDELNSNSVVFDLGGYEGQWASDIFSKYLSNVYVFEPFNDYYKNIKARFKKNSKIQVFQFGLSNKKSKVQLLTNGDATSQFLDTADGHATNIKLEDFKTFCLQHRIKKIDLMKINIEGGEYDLLDRVIETGWHKKIYNLQVQFHDYTDDSDDRMRSIQRELSKTHKPTYQYEYVWENWKLK